MDTRNSPTNSLSPAAFEKLLQNRQEFLGFLERRLRSREDAGDILQLAFIRGIERGSRLRDEESVVAWFYRVLRNAVIDHYRRTVAASRVMEEWGDDLDRVADPNGTLKESICGCLAQVIPDLKAEYRQALEIINLDECGTEHLLQSSLKSTFTHVFPTAALKAMVFGVGAACQLNLLLKRKPSPMDAYRSVGRCHVCFLDQIAESALVLLSV